MMNSHSIGIIGGADGPTAVFVTGHFPWEVVVLIGICIIGLILFIKRKK